MGFARRAVSTCDRCGERKRLDALRHERRTGLLVCPRCHDDQHPQERPYLGSLVDMRPILDARTGWRKNPADAPAAGVAAIAWTGWPKGHGVRNGRARPDGVAAEPAVGTVTLPAYGLYEFGDGPFGL